MIQRERLAKDFDAMAQLTAPGEGINRLAFTDADWKGRQYIIDCMTDAGLTVEIDDFGNVLGYKVGKNLIYRLSWLVLIRTACLMEAIMMVWWVYYLLSKRFVV